MSKADQKVLNLKIKVRKYKDKINRKRMEDLDQYLHNKTNLIIPILYKIFQYYQNNQIYHSKNSYRNKKCNKNIHKVNKIYKIIIKMEVKFPILDIDQINYKKHQYLSQYHHCLWVECQ